MSWCWLAALPAPPPDGDADAWAPLTGLDGSEQGALAIWMGRRRPHPDALRADGRILDRDGPAATISLVLAPASGQLLFDDPAVQQARRAVLAAPPQDAVSTLMRDASHFHGAITVARSHAGRIGDDPFARIHPARVLRVGAGVVGRIPAPAGPTIERHGSANPWPWPTF